LAYPNLGKIEAGGYSTNIPTSIPTRKEKKNKRMFDKIQKGGVKPKPEEGF
jgi:hypothetical protein